MDTRTKDRVTVTKPSDREFALTRVFDAPRGLVYDAWTKPEHVRRWYGCSIMTLTSCEIDLRVGGTYRYVMRAPDGATHMMSGVYREIVPTHRLVYAERYEAENFASGEMLVTVTFVEQDGRTTLTSTVLHKTAEDCDGHLKSGVERGATDTFDRLAMYLHSMA